MIELLLSQLIYGRLTDIAYQRFQMLMSNNNPHALKVIRAGDVVAILGNPNACQETHSFTRCEWFEGNRNVTVTFNNVVRDTVSNWSASGF
jgi:hypothetical protein